MQLVLFIRLDGEFVPQNYSVKISRIRAKNQRAVSKNNSTRRSLTCSSEMVEEKAYKEKYPGTTVIANTKFLQV